MASWSSSNEIYDGQLNSGGQIYPQAQHQPGLDQNNTIVNDLDPMCSVQMENNHTLLGMHAPYVEQYPQLEILSPVAPYFNIWKPTSIPQDTIYYQSIQNMPTHSFQELQPPELQIQTTTAPFLNVNPTLLANYQNSVNVGWPKYEKEKRMEAVKINQSSKQRTKHNNQKKRHMAELERLLVPKSPLVLFLELYKDVTITVKERTAGDYSASFEVDGVMYFGDDTSIIQAKQNACENFFRTMFKKNLNEISRKLKSSSDEVHVYENSSSEVQRGPPQEHFSWINYASLAMFYLTCYWNVYPDFSFDKEINIKPPEKKFPDNPHSYDPVGLLYRLKKNIKFDVEVNNSRRPPISRVTVCVDDVSFFEEAPTKKEAKRKCAIAAIKHFWKFDFQAEQTKRNE